MLIEMSCLATLMVAKPPVNPPTLQTRMTLTANPKMLKILFTLTNKTKNLLRFQFMNAQEVDFVLSEAASKKVLWRWSEGQMFAEMVQTKMLAPNKAFIYSAEFKPSQPLSRGTYRVVATFMAQRLDAKYRTATATFIVK